jgi:hypothetical protein
MDYNRKCDHCLHRPRVGDGETSRDRLVRDDESKEGDNVAEATSRPLIFRSLPAPHRTYTTAPHPRHLPPTPQLLCLCRVMSCQCYDSVMSVPCHTHFRPCPTPVLSKLRNSTLREGSLRFWPLPRPSSVFSLFLCLCITWTILRSFPCINSGPVLLPVPHLNLFWLWAQVSLHLYIVRDLLTSGFGHRSASAQVAFDIPHSSSLVRCTSACDTQGICCGSICTGNAPQWRCRPTLKQHQHAAGSARSQ